MADLTASIAIKILDAFTGPLRGLQHGLEDVEKRGERVKKAMSFAADLNQASESMSRFANGILGPVKGAINEFAEFDHALSRMSAMGGDNAKRGSAGFELLKQQAVDLGAATQYSAQEVAELQTEYLKSNFSVQEAASVTKQTLAAATAEGLGLAETSSIVGGALRGMGLEVSQTARVTDVLSTMSIKSKTDMRGLGEALGYAAGPASQLGLSIETTAAMLGVLANNNIEASRGGTALNAVMKGIIKKPNKDDLDAWRELRISNADLVKMRKSMSDDKPEIALRRMSEALKKLSKEKQVQVLQRLFGDEGAGAAGFLIRSSIDVSDIGLGALKKAGQDATGTTLEMAKIMQEDLKGAIERAGGAVSALNTKVGELLAPAATEAASTIEKMTGGLQGFIAENPKFSKATLELVTGLGLTAAGLASVLTWTSAVTSANAFLSASYGKLAGSMVGRLGLIAAAGAAGYAVGSWANEAFGLDDKIASLLGRGKTGGDKPLNAGEGDETTASGWRISKEGKVLDEGTGPGPLAVQRARAAGATTKEEISAFIQNERKNKPKTPFSVVPVKGSGPTGPIAGTGTLLERGARVAAALASPLAQVKTDSQQAAETRAQTAILLDELKLQTAAMQTVAAALANRNQVGTNLDVPTF